MKIGFTGTRFGMKPAQREAVAELLTGLKVTEGHHGDCVGADSEFHDLLMLAKLRIVIHPPIDNTRRKLRQAYNEIRKPLTHFARNRAIVNETDGLIAAPYQMEWQPNGGTWYTHDYARKVGKNVLIVWPDGTVLVANGDGKPKASNPHPAPSGEQA